MQPKRTTLMALLLLGLLALAPRPTAAQEILNKPEASEAFLWPRNLHNYAMAPAPGEISELRSYLSAGEENDAPLPSRSFLNRAPAEGPSTLILFARLAGVFMGRVSPLSVGDLRICFKIDIL